MHVYVARHACTDWNDQDRVQGHTNTFLNKHGLQQAKQLAKALGTTCPPPEGIVSSDLHRARQTAEVVALTLSIPTVVYDRRLRECHYGRLDGMFRKDVRKEYGDPFVDRGNYDYDYRALSGESHQQVLTRQLAALRELSKKNDLEHWLLVGHGRSLSTLLRFFDPLFEHHKIPEQGDFLVVDLNITLLFS